MIWDNLQQQTVVGYLQKDGYITEDHGRTIYLGKFNKMEA